MFVVPGFVSATELRPADVLTSALGNAEAVPGSALFAYRAAEATYARYATQFGALHKQHVGRILIAWTSYRGSNPRSTVLPHAQDASVATEGSLHQLLQNQTTSEMWTRTSHARSAPAGVSLNFLQTSCMIRLPVVPSWSRSLPGPFFSWSLSSCSLAAFPWLCLYRRR